MVALGIALYLLPVAALLVARAERDRQLWAIALDLPLAVALDMMLLLLVSRVVPLEKAAFATRGIEVLAAAGWVLRRRSKGSRVGYPRALGPGALAAAAGGAATLLAVSLSISRTYQIWDRFWHISLVSTIRAQTLPYLNVYDPARPLSYHYSGDALAAALQALTGLSIHSSHALSLTHDIMFALSGATVALLLVAFGSRSWLFAVVGAAVWVFSGPSALLRDDDKQWMGYNFINYVTLSFRPHVSVAGLFIAGIVGAFAVRVRERGDRERPDAYLLVAISLVILISALSVTDEASVAVLAVGIGVAWLVMPSILGPTRKHGIVVLCSMAAGMVAANLLFAGLLSPGAERPPMSLVSWRSPGFAHPTLPFSAPRGAQYFFQDVAALLLFAAGSVLVAIRKRTRPDVAAAAFTLTLVAIAVFALGRFNIPPKPVEAHRFVTAAMVAVPLLVLLTVAGGARAAGAGPLTAVLLGAALLLPAASTLAWLRSPGKTAFQTQASFASTEDFFKTDCSRELGVAFGETPRPTYASRSVLFIYSGCRPTFLAGRSGGHKIKTSSPLQGYDALAEMRKTMRGRGDESLDAVCPAGGGGDPICGAAIDAGECSPVGKSRGGIQIVRCKLTAELQDELLASRSTKDKKPEPRAAPHQPDDEPDVESTP